MRAKISYEDSRGRTSNTHVRPGQQLVVGSSFSADIVLGDTDGVAGEHVALWVQENEFSLRNLTGNEATVQLNGKSTSQGLLGDGDVIEIGSNRLIVSIEQSSQQSESASSGSSIASIGAAKSSTQAEANAGVAIAENETKPEEKSGLERLGKVSVLTVDRFVETVFPILESEDLPWRCALICNHQRSGSEAEKPESANLLQGAPEEITQENDLFLESITDRGAMESMWEKYVSKDAGVIGVFETEQQKLAIERRFGSLAAWFMVPSRLTFHLSKGSALLNDKIFSLFSFLVISDDSGDQILFEDSTIDDLDGFLKLLRKVDS